MKTSIARAGLLLALAALFCLPISTIFATDTNSGTVAATFTPQPTVAAEAPAATASAPSKLPYGVDDVLKLNRAQISEDIILNYVQNSGTIYNLGAQDLIYLRNQGVSDRVVQAMLAQRQRTADAAAAQVAAQPAPAATAPAGAPAPAPPYTDPSAGYPEPAPASAQPAPASSSVYVIPYPAASTAYYGYYPSYPYYAGPYYGGYYGPVVSFGFRFGGGWGRFCGHGFSGGHRGHRR